MITKRDLQYTQETDDKGNLKIECNLLLTDIQIIDSKKLKLFRGPKQELVDRIAEQMFQKFHREIYGDVELKLLRLKFEVLTRLPLEANSSEIETRFNEIIRLLRME